MIDTAVKVFIFMDGDRDYPESMKRYLEDVEIVVLS